VKLSRILQLVGGLAIAAAGLAIFFRHVDLHKLGTELRATSIWAVVAGLALAVLTIWFRAIRFKLILPDSPGTHKRMMFQNVMISYMINNVLPARLGEVAKVLLLWKRNKYRPTEGVGSLVVERLLDTATLAMLFIIPVFVLPVLQPLRSMATILLGVWLCGAMAAGLYVIFPKAWAAVARKLVVLLPAKIQKRVQKVGIELLSGLRWAFDIKKVLVIVVLSFLMELCYGLIFWFFLPERTLTTVLDGCFATAFGAVGAAIPLSPGYVGTLHAMALQALNYLGVDEDKGRAIAILFHAVTFLPVTAIGLWFFFKTDLSFKQIEESRKDINAEEERETTGPQ